MKSKYEVLWVVALLVSAVVSLFAGPTLVKSLGGPTEEDWKESYTRQVVEFTPGIYAKVGLSETYGDVNILVTDENSDVVKPMSKWRGNVEIRKSVDGQANLLVEKAEGHYLLGATERWVLTIPEHGVIFTE